MFKDALGDRMKNYENVPKNYLERKKPVIIRIDGKAFHSFTRGFKRPFDAVFRETMKNTMKYLCENVQGCVFGYTQSDEITLVLIDYQKEDSDAWFGYGVQKMASIAASIATMIFNKSFIEEAVEYYWSGVEDSIDPDKEADYKKYASKFHTAMFDARVFSLPREEVVNCIIWRQQDAIRNSIQSVGQTYFSHKQLEGKKNNDILDMLKEKGIDWANDYSEDWQRGAACYRIHHEYDVRGEGDEVRHVERNPWFVDNQMPIITEDKEYVERFI